MKIVYPIILLLFCLLNIHLAQTKCTDRPQCFSKKIFNFNFPQMNIYSIKAVDSQNSNFSMKAYGDFNNDLYTDFAAVDQNGQILIYVWNSNSLFYQKVFSQPVVKQCKPKTIYLYDTSDDGRLDFIVWGKSIGQLPQTNCLIPFVRNITEGQHVYHFQMTTMLDKIQLTSDPILITHKFEANVDDVGLLIYKHNSSGKKVRMFLKYRNIASPVYQSIDWNTLMKNATDYEEIGFKNPHWNTFMDLTGDCQPDLIILNEKSEAEVWISEGKTFSLYTNKEISNTIRGFTISDINYDGSGDLVLAYQKSIKIFLNQQSLQPDSQFCNPQSRSFNLDQNFIQIIIPQQKSIKQQTLHFGDINIDGYPDLLIILVDQNGDETPQIFKNNFQSSNSFSLFSSPNYNDPLKYGYKKAKLESVSFIDILQNGILDIIVCEKEEGKEGKILTKFYYNNFLLQNDYYIKGFGLQGPNSQIGSQFPGMSFYWVNSVKDGFKVTYQSQMIQTSSDALQMPYTFCGLGRANNYVQSFTVGRNGIKQVWSPIIPNSQLGVFTTHSQPDQWEVKIFAFPLTELLDVIYVTTIILALFGFYLAFRKCQIYRKKEIPEQMPL